MPRSRILFYVQHLLGIGHLARASRIADVLVQEGFAVTVVTGGMPVAGFPGPRIDVVALPPIRSNDNEFTALVDERGNPVDDALQQRRRDMLLATLHMNRPDVLIVEAYPFGRRQMRFELLPLIEAARAMKPRPLIVSSVRDILQVNRRPGRAEETISLIETFFDLVMVHGDPGFARLEETFPPAGTIASKIAYTGLVGAAPPQNSTENFDVIVSCGGGAAAGQLLIAAMSAAEQSRSATGPWCIITGPNLVSAIPKLVSPRIRIFTFRPDFASLLGGAKLSVSQAGYNTVCDILRACCRAILVPFAAGGETEQTMRAGRLQALGLAHVIAENELSAGILGRTIDSALALPAPARHGLNLDGARGAARLLRERLDLSVVRSA